MEHYRYLVAQHFHIVLFHIPTAHQHFSASHVIEAAHQVHQAGLGASGASDDPDGLSGADLKIDIFEHRLFTVSSIGEIHVPEFNASVRHIHHRFFRIVKIAGLLKHF